VTKDVWDEQHYIDECFIAWRKWQGKEQPGFWIDMDMIPFGQLQLMSPPSKDGKKPILEKGDIALTGLGVMRHSLLTKPQMKTFITLRAMAASPLMMGGDLPTLDDFSLRLLTDREMIACNQHGVMGSLKYEKGGLETWRVDRKETTGAGWVGVFNRSDREISFELIPDMLGLGGRGYKLTDVWNNEVKTFGRAVTLHPYDVLFLQYQAAPDAK
jgi:hypothetical protein